MYYHKPTKTAFYANPKTASTSTAQALTKQLNFEQIGPHHHGPPENSPETNFSFCTVRNHFDMIISWHYYIQNNDLIHPPIDLERTKLLTEQHMDTYVTDNLMWPVAQRCPVIMKYNEDIEKQLNHVLYKLHLDVVSLPKKKYEDNRPRKKPFNQYFTDEAEKYILERFEQEMKYYDFV